MHRQAKPAEESDKSNATKPMPLKFWKPNWLKSSDSAYNSADRGSDDANVVKVVLNDEPEGKAMPDMIQLPDRAGGDVRLGKKDLQWLTDIKGNRVSLGKGRYGHVYRGKLYGNEPVAIKHISFHQLESFTSGTVKTSRRNKIERLLGEVDVLKACRSDYIIDYRGYYLDEDELQLVMELAAGDLFSAIHNGSITWWKHGYQIALDVAAGLHYLHSRSPKVIHFDLKSKNILYTTAYRGKITDVGLAEPVSSHVESGGMCAYVSVFFFWLLSTA